MPDALVRLMLLCEFSMLLHSSVSDILIIRGVLAKSCYSPSKEPAGIVLRFSFRPSSNVRHVIRAG